MAKTLFVKNNMKDKQLVKLLAFIIAATESAVGYCFAPPELVNQIVAAKPEFLVVDAATKDTGNADASKQGNVKVQSTAVAKTALEAFSQETAAAASAAPAQTAAVSIDKGIPVPVGKRGPTRVETYPFSKMEIGDSIFIPTSEAQPNPAKDLSSTVGSATKRYNVATAEMETATRRNGTTFQRAKMQQTRKFIIRPVEGGARIWRVAVPTPEVAAPSA